MSDWGGRIQASVPAKCSSAWFSDSAEALDIWRAGEAFDRIRAAWLDCALGLGERIAIKNGADQREGMFEGIDATGRLLMRSEHGLETIEAADLWLMPSSGALPRAVPSASHRPEGRV